MKPVQPAKLVLRACVGAAVVAAAAAVAVPFVAAAADGEGTVTGHVVGTGLDLTGYSVVLTNDDANVVVPVQQDGTYTAELDAGTYDAGLQLEDDDSGRYFTSLGSDVTVVADTTVTHDVEYAVVTGTVSGSGAPLPEGEVQAFRTEEDRYNNSAYVDGTTGDYELVVVVDDDEPTYLFAASYDSRWSGEYYDDARDLASATPISLTVGQTFTADFALPATTQVTGRLTGFPSGATSLDRTVMLTDQVTGDPMGWAQITRTGGYRVRYVAPGRYLLSFGRGSGPALTMGTFNRGVAETSKGSATVIEVGTDGTAIAIPAVATKRGAAFSGTIVTSKGKARANLRVVAVPTNRAASTRSTLTRKDGTYALTGLAPGTYNVYVWNAARPSPGSRPCKQLRIARATVRSSGTVKLGKDVFSTSQGTCGR